MKGCCVAIGGKSMARDLGWKVSLQIGTDSSAAKGIASRRGAGKVRHIHTPTLWVQRQVYDTVISVKKVPGPENVADLGTKHLGHADMVRMLKKCSIEFVKGRHSLALRS